MSLIWLEIWDVVEVLINVAGIVTTDDELRSGLMLVIQSEVEGEDLALDLSSVVEALDESGVAFRERVEGHTTDTISTNAMKVSV